MYDVAIIGGGPAGIAAGVYASRKQLKSVVLTKEWGGQSSVSSEIQNWIGTVSISGADLVKNLKRHLDAYAGDIVTTAGGAAVTKVETADGGFRVTTEDGKSYEAKTILVASGAHRRKLEVPGADTFDQKGLTYCASCDGPLFSGMDVAVVGGGNAGFETAAQLLAYTKSVTILQHGPEFKADPVTVKKVLSNPKVHAVTNAETVEVKGGDFVTGIVYRDKESGETKEVPVSGIFVEIGILPTTEFVSNLVELDPYKRIVVDAKSQRTSRIGIWAAGDCTNELYHQNNIAAGDAVKAVEDIYVYLHAR